MMTVETERRDDGYVLGRTDTEYERLRAQSRVWEAATGRLLDQVALAPGASCLDAGCGPGETMRQFTRVDLTSGEPIPGALQSVSVQPALDSFEEVGRAIIDAFIAAGCDVHIGARLPDLFAQAGIGAPTLANFTRDAERFPERPTLWPLLIGAWKRKPHGAESERLR